MKQTVIFLVRHGQTDFLYSRDSVLDAKRVLTKEGILQCQKVGEYLAEFSPQTILASPLERTMQSANAIAKQCQEIAVTPEPRLLEVYSNERIEQIEKDLPVLLTELTKQYAGGQVVLVTHMDVILYTLRALGVSQAEVSFEAAMAGVYRLVFVDEVFVEVTYLTPAI